MCTLYNTLYKASRNNNASTAGYVHAYLSVQGV